MNYDMSWIQERMDGTDPDEALDFHEEIEDGYLGWFCFTGWEDD